MLAACKPADSFLPFRVAQNEGEYFLNNTRHSFGGVVIIIAVWRSRMARYGVSAALSLPPVVNNLLIHTYTDSCFAAYMPTGERTRPQAKDTAHLCTIGSGHLYTYTEAAKLIFYFDLMAWKSSISTSEISSVQGDRSRRSICALKNAFFIQI